MYTFDWTGNFTDVTDSGKLVSVGVNPPIVFHGNLVAQVPGQYWFIQADDASLRLPANQQAYVDATMVWGTSEPTQNVVIIRIRWDLASGKYYQIILTDPNTITLVANAGAGDVTLEEVTITRPDGNASFKVSATDTSIIVEVDGDVVMNYFDDGGTDGRMSINPTDFPECDSWGIVGKDNADGSDGVGTRFTAIAFSDLSVAGPANLKTLWELPLASIKTWNGLAIANLKSWNGVL